MHANDIPLIPPQASDTAFHIDLLILGMTAVTAFFTLGIFIAILYFVVRYRRGHKVDRSNPPLYELRIETAWTFIPMGIAVALFVWASVLYLHVKRVPPGAMEIYVVGKQWMWKLQHPEGRWEMNELHVPTGRPVSLTMTSEDVIHDFSVPEFRVKQDVVPGEYQHLWFQATRPGTYHLFCAQFCGTFHSRMTGTVTVMEPQDYERWLAAGSYQGTLAQRGAEKFIQHGCDGCHGPASSVRAPSLVGIYGKPVAVQTPQSGVPLDRTPAHIILADDKYIHDSIVLPEKEVVGGYRPIMPSFKNELSEEEIVALVAYIKSLAGGTPQSAPPQEPLGLEEYKTRVGFTPKNMKALSGAAGATAAGGSGGGAAGAGQRTRR